jgi:hypothetical protein
MAHFCELDNGNIVLRVIVICNEDCIDENGNENENTGINFCKYLYGENTNWIQTSYTGKIRKNFAGIGYKYDSFRDAFIAPKPSDEYDFDETKCIWIRNVTD